MGFSWGSARVPASARAVPPLGPWLPARPRLQAGPGVAVSQWLVSYDTKQTKTQVQGRTLRSARYSGGCLAALGVGEWPVGPSPGPRAWEASSALLPSTRSFESPLLHPGGAAVRSGHRHAALWASDPMLVSQSDTARSLGQSWPRIVEGRGAEQTAGSPRAEADLSLGCSLKKALLPNVTPGLTELGWEVCSEKTF